MLKKIVRDLLIVFGIAVMALSTSRTFMAWISETRNEVETWWGVHKPVEGDLVSMSYLDKEKKFLSLRDYKFVKHPVDSGHIDLYAWGDSHIWKIPDSAYAAVHKYTYVWRNNADMLYDLDSTKKNVLLIEITERYLRSYFSSTEMFDRVRRQDATAAVVATGPAIRYAGADLKLVEELFNPYINQNIEFNLFNYNFINPVRQWKASMNYHLFARASGDVVLSNDGQQLFLKETVRGAQVTNSYHPVSDEEIGHIVENINRIDEHYREEGFDEVYLSIIPNPVAILQPEGTNNLVPRVEGHPGLKIKLISIYDLYKKETRRIYRPGDSHWNNTGLQIWLSEVNKVLLSQPVK